VVALAAVLVLAVACGSKAKKAAPTTTVESTTTSTVLAFCDRAPSFVQSLNDTLGTELTQAKTDTATYSRLQDDVRALDQNAHDLLASSPDELKVDLNDIVTGLDQMQTSLQASPPPSDPGFQQVGQQAADPKFTTAVDHVKSYVANTCGTGSSVAPLDTATSTPGASSNVTPRATTRRPSTATTRRVTTGTTPRTTVRTTTGTTTPPTQPPTTAPVTTHPPVTVTLTFPPTTKKTATTKAPTTT
jgi:hypothetical protein